MTGANRPDRPWGPFVAWMLVGASYPILVLGAFTIGPFVLPLAMGATVLLVRIDRGGLGVPGVISGAGLPFLLVAWLSHDETTGLCSPAASHCTQGRSSWPWLAAGGVLVALGLAVFLVRGARVRSSVEPPARWPGRSSPQAPRDARPLR